MMDVKGLGRRIRQSRIAKGWRQEDLAERANLSVAYIGMMERDEKVPRVPTLVEIANVLEVTTDELLEDSLYKGYQIKASQYAERIRLLPEASQERIYAVLDSLLENP